MTLENKVNKLSIIKKIRYFYAVAVVNVFKMDYSEAISICDDGLGQLKKSKINSIHVINLLKTQCLIHLNQMDEALKSLKQAEKNRVRKTHNLAPFSELYFFIHTRSGNYEYALQEYDKAISGNFLSQSQIYFESWRQYGLLLLFLIKLDKIPPSELLERLKPKLRLGKLLNEMPEYSKDKAGLNLAIRILHVLILLTSKKFEEFEEALVPLQSYIQRYKRHHPEIFRCDLMVKMLSLIPRVHYDAARTSWRARPFLEKMLVPPEQLPLKVTEMEVIPYEKMWDYVIEFLGTLKRRPYSSKAAD
ncbi:MAG: hypothetical protein IPJ00_05725 [Saprospirales bacterium]|nr:hypothetical protein [Saprospirales bacterium]